MNQPPGPELFLLPYEATTSYLAGTREGPGRLLPLVTPEPFRSWETVEQGATATTGYLEAVAERTARSHGEGRAVAAIGGEHTVTFGILAGLVAAGTRPVVVQLDAHADLRADYEGTPWSHACVMRRVIEILDLPTLAVGIRSLSVEEADFIREHGLPTIFAHRLDGTAFAPLLPPGRDLYITVDIDFFDPSVAPGTGTPEPGGPGWYQGLSIIESLLENRRLIGFDIVEFSPPVEDAVTARAVEALARHLARRLPQSSA